MALININLRDDVAVSDTVFPNLTKGAGITVVKTGGGGSENYAENFRKRVLTEDENIVHLLKSIFS